MRLATLLFAVAACSGADVSFVPRLAVSPAQVVVKEGMEAWGDIEGSQLVDLPDWMTMSEHTAWVPHGPIPEDTTLTFTCPTSAYGDACDLYVYVYHCPPCVLHGGLPAALLADGWTSGSCAPKFTLPLGGVHKMVAFRKQLQKGESTDVATTAEGRFVGIATTTRGFVCSTKTKEEECVQGPYCAWERGVCVDKWCKRKVFTGPTSYTAPMCSVCADAYLPTYPGVTEAPVDPPSVARTAAPPTQAPATDAPATQAPATDAPATKTPATAVPLTVAPVVPSTYTPQTGAPATGAPATDAPATKAPATAVPLTVAPVVPSTNTPQTGAPATGAPATDAPATDAPATKAPATAAPVVPPTVAPLTQAPLTAAPLTDSPRTEAPTTRAPATSAPATEAPETAVPVTPAPPTVAPTLAPTPVPVPVPTPAGPLKTTNLAIEMTNCADDTEELLNSGRVNAMSTDLDMSRNQAGQGLQLVGLRWRNVQIPKDAVIVSARVEFRASATSDSEPTSLLLGFERSGSPPNWARSNPSARTLLDTTEWVVTDQWVQGGVYQSANLAADLQNLIELPQWNSGNAVALVVSPGTQAAAKGIRHSDSCEGGKGPVLRVTYVQVMEPQETLAPDTPVPETPSPPNNQQCPPRVRKAYSRLSCKEREDYADAVDEYKKLFPQEHNRFVETHWRAQDFAHYTAVFLPWHRWYLIQFENALRKVPGRECITIPYWDWEKDAGDQLNSSPLRHRTFGSTSRHSNLGQRECVNSGVISDWRDRRGTCLARRYDTGVDFAGEGTMSGIIVNENTFAGFWPRLEGGPHVGPHAFIGGQMSTMSSPEDPLFFMHHANVDRMWALWQDYYGHDAVPKDQTSEVHYVARVMGWSSINPRDVGLDSVMQFPYDNSGSVMDEFSEPMTAREMLHLHDMPGDNEYTYGSDCLASIVGQPRSGDWDWLTPGCAAEVTCPHHSTTRKAATASLDDAPGEVWYENRPIFTDPDIQYYYDLLTQMNLPHNEILVSLGYRECRRYGNGSYVSEEWEHNMGLNGDEPYTKACSVLPEEDVRVASAMRQP